MSLWTRMSALMDQTVDSLLSDEVRYSIAGAPFLAIEAFVEFQGGATPEFDEIDELGLIPRLKVAKSIVTKPTLNDRVQCSGRLGNRTWRPVGKLDREQGRYWLFDLQKV